MALENPPIQEKTSNQMGVFPQVWIKWFGNIHRYLSGKEPIKLRTATIATLPDVSNVACIIYISDEIGGPVPAFSDGVNWRRVTDRAIVS